VLHDVEPADVACFPDGQLVHEVAAADPLYLPTGQLVHCVTPGQPYFPAAQFEHALMEFEAVY